MLVHPDYLRKYTLTIQTGVNTETLETAYKAGRPGRYKAYPTGMQAMSQLRFSIRYDLRRALPNGWSGTAPIKLPSGNAYSPHGDFITDGPRRRKGLVEATADEYGYISVDGGFGKGDEEPTCEAVNADPSQGTGGYFQSVAALSKLSVPAFGWTSRNRFARSN